MTVMEARTHELIQEACKTFMSSNISKRERIALRLIGNTDSIVSNDMRPVVQKALKMADILIEEGKQ